MLRQMSEMVQYVECRGHTVTFAFLAFALSYSRDPNVRTVYVPSPDCTDYIVSLNALIKTLGSRNPLGSCFSNRRVGLSATRKQVKSQDWQGYNSATDNLTVAFENCYTYTTSVLANWSFDYISHVNIENIIR